MKRIILDTQSNRLFVGDEAQQEYDQRGGLCQVGAGHAVVTTHPIAAEYLAYWQNIGFSLPQLWVAGPFDPRYTLAALILQNPPLQDALRAFAADTPARLEFLYVEDHEPELSRALDIPGYCHFELSRHLAHKIPFKRLCQQLDLPTTPYVISDTQEHLFQEAEKLLQAGHQVLFKANGGSGGLGAGGMFKITTLAELHEFVRAIKRTDFTFLVEPILTNITEISIHWEMLETGKIKFLAIFDRILRNFTYCGGSYPDTLPAPVKQRILSQLHDILGPYLLEHGARGYLHCDIIITDDGRPLWTDFNPRKGGLIYIFEMVHRFAAVHFSPAVPLAFWHESFDLSAAQAPHSWSQVFQTLDELLHPGSPCVVLTNPGLLRFGHIHLTGISTHSVKEARDITEKAIHRLS